MQESDRLVLPADQYGFAARFLIFLGSFLAMMAAAWPVVFSFDLWVMKDRSSFLNLDYLIEKHYRLGIDAFYAYGLLPVYVQHVVFQLFGRSYKPMIGCSLVIMVFAAAFWALLLGELRAQRRMVWGVAALSVILIAVNPNFPYSLVVLSIQFALYFVLRKRLDLALVCAVVGCFCVPSLPLVLTLLLVAALVVEWWLSYEERTSVRLARKLLPGVVVYAGLFAGLSLFFGLRSMLITALPVLGSRFYQANGMNKFEAFLSFLHPPGNSLKYYCVYYVSSSVTWFVLCTLAVVVMGVIALARQSQRREIDYRGVCVILCAVMQVVFIFFAYGNRAQHAIYEPVLAAGTLVGITLMRRARVRSLVLAVFIAVGILGESWQVYKTGTAWRNTSVAQNTAGLYCDPDFTGEFSTILQIAEHHRVLMLSYASGVHHYFPSIQNPDVWFLYPGQLLPEDMRRMLDKIDHSDVIVDDLTSPSAVAQYNSEVQAHMAHMHELAPMRNFRVWVRDGIPLKAK